MWRAFFLYTEFLAVLEKGSSGPPCLVVSVAMCMVVAHFHSSGPAARGYDGLSSHLILTATPRRSGLTGLFIHMGKLRHSDSVTRQQWGQGQDSGQAVDSSIHPLPSRCHLSLGAKLCFRLGGGRSELRGRVAVQGCTSWVLEGRCPLSVE